MLPMQNKQKIRKSIRSGRATPASSNASDLLKGISSRICSKYDKVIEDGPNSKRILYRSKNVHTPSDLKSVTTSVSRFTTDFPDDRSMSDDMRLTSGHHNPCVINLMKQFECNSKSKILPPVLLPENLMKPTVIQIHLSESASNPFLQRHLKCLYMSEKKRPRKMTRGTQTLYRESSMQTLPYLPDVSNDKETLKTLELYKLPKILKGDGPPGLFEVEILERARKRWAIEKSLNEDFQCAIKTARKDISQKKKIAQHKAILEAFEWESWLEREEHIQGCQMMRFQLVLRIFEKRQREMHKVSDVRIQKCCEQIVQKRDHALQKNDTEFGREMRRLQVKYEKKPRNWRKEKISDELGDPSSEYYAPKMRYGVNPNRRHFQLSRKAFEMRMEDLEKRAVNMKNLKCPFAKLKEWSKPKEQKTEVEQNFCSETNLQKLYEGLKGLREQSKRQKIIPKCLIEKAQKSFVEKTVLSEECEVEELEISPEICTVEVNEEETQAGISYSQDSLLEMYSQRNSHNFTISQLLEERRREELESMLAEYEGTTIGWLMRFLSEERSRLQEQRKLHFVTMLAQKERWRREAAEAGLRQKENEMRKIYEQIFDEADRSNSEVCEQYLDNIFGIDTQEQADFEATASITDLARIIDRDLQRWLTSFKQIQNPLNYDDLRCLLRDLVFPDSIADCLSRKYEAQSIIDYIINDVLLEGIYERLEPYDVAHSITTNFVDRLLDTDLYLFSPDCSSDCDCHEKCTCQPYELETKAILRKLIRYSVPGRRWRTRNERIADENVNDVIDDICGAPEKAKRCTFTPGTSRVARVVKEIPSEINLLNNSYIEYDKTNTSMDTTSDNTFLDTITVVNYTRAKKNVESRKPSLVYTEQLIWEDATRSSSELQMVDELSPHGSNDRSRIHPYSLKEIASNFDMTMPLEPFKGPYSSSDEDDELLHHISFNANKPAKQTDNISASFLASIFDQVVRSCMPSQPDNESRRNLKKTLTAKKSVMSMEKRRYSSDDDSFNIEAEVEAEKETEERGFPQSLSLIEPLEEERVSKVSEYEMVMYEGELKKILFDEDDECQCQIELDYKNSIRQLFESGKIKVIYRQKLAIEQKQESEAERSDINIAEMIFEYASSGDQPLGVITEEGFNEAEEFAQIIDEELITIADELDENPKEIEATTDVSKDPNDVDKTLATTADVPGDVAVDADVVEEAAEQEIGVDADVKETEEAADIPQNTGVVADVMEEGANAVPVAETEGAADIPQNTGDVGDVIDEGANAAPAAETEQQPAENETEPVAPEESPQEQPQEEPQEEIEQNEQPPVES